MSGTTVGPDPFILALTESLAAEKFYGSLELKFESGQIVLARKIENIKPDRRDNRGQRQSNGVPNEETIPR